MKGKRIILTLIIIAALMPAIGIAAQDPSAATGLVTCTENCGFGDLMKTIDKVIKFILFDLAIPIAAIMFAYAGFKMVFSGGSSEGMTTAKSIFFNTVVGLLLAAGAFLIIETILAIFGFEGSWLGFINRL